MPLVDCLGAVANALQIKEVTDKVDALVKKGKHPAEAEAIAKREFISDEFGKLNDELNGIKKEVGVKAGKAEKLKPVNFSELNKKYKADKEAATRTRRTRE
jgi:archaellum component FlaC